MAHRESPAETFKRALAHAARSLAEQPDLEVIFSGDGPSLTGHRAMLPHPPRDLSGPETTRIRGLADQMALRVAHHDDRRPRQAPGPSRVEGARGLRGGGAGAHRGDRRQCAGAACGEPGAVLEHAIQQKGLDRFDRSGRRADGRHRWR